MNETNGGTSENNGNNGGTRSGELLSDVEASNNNENTQLDQEGSETRTDNVEPGRGGSHSADAPEVRPKVIIDKESVRIAPELFDTPDIPMKQAVFTLQTAQRLPVGIASQFIAIIVLLKYFEEHTFRSEAEYAAGPRYVTPFEIRNILKGMCNLSMDEYDIKEIIVRWSQSNYDSLTATGEIYHEYLRHPLKAITIENGGPCLAPALFETPLSAAERDRLIETVHIIDMTDNELFDLMLTLLRARGGKYTEICKPVYLTPFDIHSLISEKYSLGIPEDTITRILINKLTAALDLRPMPLYNSGVDKDIKDSGTDIAFTGSLKLSPELEDKADELRARHQYIKDNYSSELDLSVIKRGEITMTTEIDTLNMPYIDRELSWLQFNSRVLSLALNENTPLLERVKFLSIANSNLDEFFAIRMAARLAEDDEDDLDSRRILNQLIRECKSMVTQMDFAYKTLVEKLALSDIHILTDFERNKVKKYFNYTIKPALAPLALDATRPIPHLKPFAIYIALFLENTDGTERMGLIEIPTHLDRIVKIGKHGWYFIEDIILANITDLYPGSKCSDITIFRVIRDGDTVVVDEDKNYVETMIMNVQSRMLYNDPVRLDILTGANKKIKSALQSSLDIPNRNVFHVEERIKMSDVIQLYKASDDETLKYPHFKPRPLYEEPAKKSMLARISKRDILVHHPYESFTDSVVRFIRDACEDPHVISIKQTLYRSGNDSKIIRYLIKAAESGKNVTVVMELKARFDEETNIEWADKLQRAGATVVYGYEHIKTHAKMVHVFRLKGKTAEQFCHIGTGNYSEKNSKIYTDYSYFTSDKKVCSDVNNIFNMLTGGFISEDIHFHNLAIAPISIRPTLYSLIDGQIALGEEGRIVLKVNNLSDRGIVEKLYQASNAGVNVDIICRSACSLIPGVEGYSTNIKVKSIVGRFLEHSRVFQFGNDVILSSADLMTRNLDRRLELMFKVTDPNISLRLQENLQVLLDDTENSFVSLPDPSGVLVPFWQREELIDETSPKPLDAHKYFIK